MEIHLQSGNVDHRGVRVADSVGRVAAIVILYHPKTGVLERLLKSVDGQVSSIFLIDNTPEGIPSYPYEHCDWKSTVGYWSMGENKGIAAAQNFGIERALKSGHTHVLLLDQDSSVPGHLVATLLATEVWLADRKKRVAAVGPVFVDEKTMESSKAIRYRRGRVLKVEIDAKSPSPVESDYVIASGSLIPAAAIKAAGAMKSDLFIDWVDIEWGLRARTLGYRSFIAPAAVMTHSIGDKTARFLGKQINLHSDLRHYYFVRNAAFLTTLPHIPPSVRIATFLRLPQYVLFYALQAKRPTSCLILLLRALLDGYRGKLGAFPPP